MYKRYDRVPLAASMVAVVVVVVVVGVVVVVVGGARGSGGTAGRRGHHGAVTKHAQIQRGHHAGHDVQVHQGVHRVGGGGGRRIHGAVKAGCVRGHQAGTACQLLAGVITLGSGATAFPIVHFQMAIQRIQAQK